MSTPSIEAVKPENGERLLPDLIRLLRATVDGGASVGFLPPLAEDEARRYWQATLQDVTDGSQVLLVALDTDGQVLGSVQLALAMKPNGRHRAEVQKLFVDPSQRRHGIGRGLMKTVEEAARAHGRTLLVLDTREGDAAEQLYRRMGYIEAGRIPGYAISSSGTLDGTIYFYKNLPTT
ncbi:GNAT family N-acetyltransferase [Dictyobacter aurantiacus]|uniref:N-acetyltransferase n=1 Tax=Dictyobacter aurantiacus TaxID=1936993 RepID=A0A401ZK96_9CHLR|nr:GNAT family N-acetyltransferase [Dictyobacter aurantiacus]GCE07269.1 N-acetyltransferase [Dictyobacter aurantiacus]